MGGRRALWRRSFVIGYWLFVIGYWGGTEKKQNAQPASALGRAPPLASARTPNVESALSGTARIGGDAARVAGASAGARVTKGERLNKKYLNGEHVGESAMVKTAAKKKSTSKTNSKNKAKAAPKAKKRAAKKGVVAKLASSIVDTVASVMPSRSKKKK